MSRRCIHDDAPQHCPLCAIERLTAERDAAREEARELREALEAMDCLCSSIHGYTCPRCAALAKHGEGRCATKQRQRPSGTRG